MITNIFVLIHPYLFPETFQNLKKDMVNQLILNPSYIYGSFEF